MLAVLAVALVPAFNNVEVRGWTHDGATIVLNAHVDIPDPHLSGTHLSDPELGYDFLVLADRDGAPQTVFRVERKVRGQTLPDAENAWRAAQSQDAGDAWLQSHEFTDAPKPSDGSSPLPIALAGVSGTVRVDGVTQQGCRHAKLVLKSAAMESPLASDTCAVLKDGYDTHDSIQIAPSPDRTRAVIVWRARMSHEAGSVDEEASHAYLIVVTPRTLASVDLLDAGAAAKTEAIARTLGDAGFPIGHRGKAQKPRAATAIYFTQGFEQPARDAAKLLGVPADAVQPATWKTPYAVTVAAGP